MIARTGVAVATWIQVAKPSVAEVILGSNAVVTGKSQVKLCGVRKP
jgi:hypothetical protein